MNFFIKEFSMVIFIELLIFKIKLKYKKWNDLRLIFENYSRILLDL